uniref:Uncharacterized protein LOC102807370 n=1 Tax=Saccoglossus kowalevskii TaxID=10224 RepID=A0ABM0MMK5_SACKO|nr:PREDICTED: uncharacterized protein LOC102807370 [Saccoglossus kowalevskii]
MTLLKINLKKISSTEYYNSLPHYGEECIGGPLENKTLSFDTSNYAKMQTSFADTTEFTVCFWMKTEDDSNVGTMVSYFASDDDTFEVENPGNIRTAINGQDGNYTEIAANYGLWHQVCAIWKSEDGDYSVYKDGNERYGFNGLAAEQTLAGDGVLVLGQKQTRRGGGFTTNTAYHGQLAAVNVFSKALSHEQVEALAMDSLNRGCGDVFWWSALTLHNLHNVPTSNSDILRTLDVQRRCHDAEFKDKSWVFSDPTSHVRLDKTIPDLTAFTMCWWMKVTDPAHTDATILSYFTDGDTEGSIVVERINSLQMLLSAGNVIHGGGSLIIGQKQSTVGGGFVEQSSFVGEVTDFNMWTEKKKSNEIQELFDKSCNTICGDSVWWPYFKSSHLTDVTTSPAVIPESCPAVDPCAPGVFDQYLWKFNNTGDFSLATMPKHIPELTEFSICYWMRLDGHYANYSNTAVSYFVDGDSEGSIVIENVNNLVVTVNNQKSEFTGIDLNNQTSHFICLLWKSEGGEFSIYDKKTELYTGYGLATGTTVREGGSLLIGQKQTVQDGGFSKLDAFYGRLRYFNMWDYTLSYRQIKKATRACDPDCGNVISLHELDYPDLINIKAVPFTCEPKEPRPIGEQTTIIPSTLADVTTAQTTLKRVTVKPTTQGIPTTMKSLTRGVPTTAKGATTERTTAAIPETTTKPPCPETETELPCPDVENSVSVIGDEVRIPHGLTNVAFGKCAEQSSSQWHSKAKDAVDGDTDAEFCHRSCSLTSREYEPWWKTDLVKPRTVNYITLTNRGDCCQSRLIGAEVRIGNKKNFRLNALCSVVTSAVASQKTIKIQCENGPLTGRYVSVQSRCKTTQLSLCEVEVWSDDTDGVIDATESPGTKVTDTPGSVVTDAATESPTDKECLLPFGLINVATTAVTQSTTQGNSISTRAVDGNKDSDFRGRSCTRTELEEEPWWKVDLGESLDVYVVTITNRMDCCSDKLLNAEVRVGDSSNIDDNALCGFRIDEDVVVQETIEIVCGCGTPLTGRYVSVQLADKTQRLSLCEVEVWAPGGPTDQDKRDTPGQAETRLRFQFR